MSHDYDHITAHHYAAYRPPLHAQILALCLDETKRFSRGLDVGCGTGQSSIALAKYCDQVIGIEPSEDMRRIALAHPSVTYQTYDGVNLEFPGAYFDMLTFAGSLFYAKSQRLLDEVVRVSKPAALVLAYDFDILLHKILHQLNISLPEDDHPYNHRENFSGLESSALVELANVMKSGTLQLKSTELAHLLLSLKPVYKILAARYNISDVYNVLVKELDQQLSGNFHDLQVNLFYTMYQLRGE